MEQPILLRRLFRRAFESNDPALLDQAFAEVSAIIGKAEEQSPAVVTLLKLLFGKAVTDKNLPLLQRFLALKPKAEWLTAACQQAGKEGWAVGYIELRRHTDRPPGITLTDAFVLGEHNIDLPKDRLPIKNLPLEVERLVEYSRKTPDSRSAVCTFLERLGYMELVRAALER